jgi:hypothetical protein
MKKSLKIVAVIIGLTLSLCSCAPFMDSYSYTPEYYYGGYYHSYPYEYYNPTPRIGGNYHYRDTHRPATLNQSHNYNRGRSSTLGRRNSRY